MNLLKTVKIVEKLEEWADNLSYTPPSTTKVGLSPSWRYKKVILLLCAKTNIGAKVEKDFAALDKLHREYENWRGKDITEDNKEKFTILVNRLKDALYDLADTLWQIAQNTREELGDEKPTETEQKTTPAKRWWIWTKKVIGWIFKETWHLVVIIIGGLLVAVLVKRFVGR